jgi:hypothetical protein
MTCKIVRFAPMVMVLTTVARRYNIRLRPTPHVRYIIHEQEYL